MDTSEVDSTCFIETKALDGEISLKVKDPSDHFKKSEFTYADFFKIDCIFEAENPNINLYQFDGNLKIRGELYPFHNQHFLPRGAVLRHTDWVIGLVVYTGHETKMMMNTKSSKNKISSIDTKV